MWKLLYLILCCMTRAYALNYYLPLSRLLDVAHVFHPRKSHHLRCKYFVYFCRQWLVRPTHGNHTIFIFFFFDSHLLVVCQCLHKHMFDDGDEAKWNDRMINRDYFHIDVVFSDSIVCLDNFFFQFVQFSLFSLGSLIAILMYIYTTYQ